jgi:hypothetical protein
MIKAPNAPPEKPDATVFSVREDLLPPRHTAPPQSGADEIN